MLYYTHFDTPIGKLFASSNNNMLTKLTFNDLVIDADYNNGKQSKNEVLIKTEKWLSQYFNGQIPQLDFKIFLQGSTFKEKVLTHLQQIKYGETTTYKEIAKCLNTHPRAVATMIKHNPIMLIIPCHRVIACNGMGGYFGKSKTDVKKYLLEFERNY